MTEPTETDTEAVPATPAAPPAQSRPATTIAVEQGGPNLLIRIVWFIFVGWWLTGIVNAIAWFLNVTIIGLPLGLYLINRIPAVATLKSSKKEILVTVDGSGMQNVAVARPEQMPWWQRAIYFILVGWWFSGVWMLLAWLSTITIILIPLGFWMYGAVGKITTLKR